MSMNLVNSAPWHEHMAKWRLSPPFLIPTLDGGEWSASRPHCFSHGTRWVTGWVRPGTALGAVEYGNILNSTGNRAPGVQPVA
jgi:hypothetical protein